MFRTLVRSRMLGHGVRVRVKDVAGGAWRRVAVGVYGGGVASTRVQRCAKDAHRG